MYAGGPIGGLALALGALTAGSHEVHDVRLGVMPVVSEPTLDFYRPLTALDRSIPLRKQSALYDEEVGIIAAVNHTKVSMCLRTPCIHFNVTYSAGAVPVEYQALPFNSGGIRQLPGGFSVELIDGVKYAPNGLPIGDNGYMVFGIDHPSGLALVLPGVLPGNAYYSEAKLAALTARDPAAANWYAVFNTPVQGGKPGEVLWTVMKGGKVVGAARLVAP